MALAGLLLACTDIQGDVDAPVQEALALAPDAAMAGPRRACTAEEYPVVFTSTRGGSANGLELYLMNFEGAVKQIGFEPRFIAPRWSPDGRAIAFRHQVKREPGATIASAVQLITPDGDERVALTDRETLAFTDSSVLPVDAPSWSPDGQTVAYAAAAATGGERVWLMPRVGGEARRLLPELERSHHSPSWGPDGSVALVIERSGVEDIWLVEADAPEWPGVDLTEGRVQMPRSLRWSPDGGRLAFSALGPLGPKRGSGAFEIYLLDVTTRELSQVTHDDVPDLHPAWSPDGTELLMARGQSAREASDRPLDTLVLALWRVPLDDPASAEQITFEGWMNCAPDWFWGGCGPR